MKKVLAFFAFPFATEKGFATKSAAIQTGHGNRDLLQIETFDPFARVILLVFSF